MYFIALHRFWPLDFCDGDVFSSELGPGGISWQPGLGDPDGTPRTK